MSREVLPKIDDVLMGDSGRKYTLMRVLGDGGFGRVYEAKSEWGCFALKAEQMGRSLLHVEQAVLRAAAQQNCRHFCQMIDQGREPPEFVFVVMTLLGKSVHELRNEQPARHFSAGTAVRVATQSLNAIEELHNIGFISRDIKPGNFAVGLPGSPECRLVYMLDFGLARKYVDDDGHPLAPRYNIGWRGTTRYGSLLCHLHQDLGRKDDVESWFYMIVEFTRASLPWRHLSNTNRAAVFEAKRLVRRGGRQHLLDSCPKQYDQLLSLIDAMVFESKPEYYRFYLLLDDALNDVRVHRNDRYDWEEATVEETQISFAIAISNQQQPDPASGSNV